MGVGLFLPVREIKPAWLTRHEMEGEHDVIYLDDLWKAYVIGRARSEGQRRVPRMRSWAHDNHSPAIGKRSRR